MTTFSTENGMELIPQFNPVVGRMQWRLAGPDYEFTQEIARSGYGDMLHDLDRNAKYLKAINVAVQYRKQKYPMEPVHVLDIGTGTGLLSMMAHNAGADVVTACEAFVPMSKCATEVLKLNGCSDVNVISKRSTDLQVGSDFNRPANMLVAELLDTELIGEAALSTYYHASKNLITEDATLVPYAADVFVQIVESPFLWSHHRISPLGLPDRCLTNLLSTGTIDACAGLASVFDIQASQLELVHDDSVALGDRQIRCLLEKPVCVKRFNFAPPCSEIKLQDEREITLTDDGNKILAARGGVAHAFVLWWRLKMEPTNTVPDISTAPAWVEDSDSCWRDHWMQAIYFTHQPYLLRVGEPFGIRFLHDSLSLSLELIPSDKLPRVELDENGPDKELDVTGLACDCGMHIAWSRTRIAQLNSVEYRKYIFDQVRHLQKELKKLPPRSVVSIILIADCSLLPFLVVDQLDQTKCGNHSLSVYHIETSPCSSNFFQNLYAQHQDKINLPIHMFDSIEKAMRHLHNDTEELDNGRVVFILAEPYTAAAILPWDSLYFWYAENELRTEYPMLNVRSISPIRLLIKAVLVDFNDLWKIRAPIGKNCMGFDLRPFDRLISDATTEADSLVEPQPLWEYAGVARSESTPVFEIVLTDSHRLPWSMSDPSTVAPRINLSTAVLKPTCSSVNGIALWAEWLIQSPDDESSDRTYWYSPGCPLEPVVPDENIVWSSVGVQQGVYLAPTDWSSKLSDSTPFVRITVNFDPIVGEQSFSFCLSNTCNDIQ